MCGESIRVPSGVKDNGFLTTMRLCVGVMNLRGDRVLCLDVGVESGVRLLCWSRFLASGLCLALYELDEVW